MPIKTHEIKSGIVALFDPAVLLGDSRMYAGILNHVRAGFRKGPFVCIMERDGRSAWLHLTTRAQANYPRLFIQDKWRSHGGYSWLSKPQYIADGRAVFCGDNETFEIASASEWPYQHGRPTVSKEGVSAILAEARNFPEYYEAAMMHLAGCRVA